MSTVSVFVFFFQAEDGIRDVAVTGVQTCALPIWRARRPRRTGGSHRPCGAWAAAGPGLRSGAPCAPRHRRGARPRRRRRADRKSGGEGKRGELRGGRNIKKKKKRDRVIRCLATVP